MFASNFWVRKWGHRSLGFLRELLDFIVLDPAHAMNQRALSETVDYIFANMAKAVSFSASADLIDYALRQVVLDGAYLEFGVYKGASINHIASRIAGKVVHGFDSFEGLPQDWAGTSLARGAFSLRGRLPKTAPNVRLHIGMFEQSLRQWLSEHPEDIAFIHIDSDIYESAATILTLVADRIRPMTVIVFDEYFNYPFWREGEFKAFQEFIQARNCRYRYLGYAHKQVATKVLP